MDSKFVPLYAGFSSWLLEASFEGDFFYSFTTPIGNNRQGALEELAGWLLDCGVPFCDNVKINLPRWGLSPLTDLDVEYLLYRTCELRDR